MSRPWNIMHYHILRRSIPPSHGRHFFPLLKHCQLLPQQHLAHTKEIFCKIRVNASTFTKLLIFFWIDEKGEGVSGRMVFLINLLSLTSQTWGVGCARALLIDFFFFVPLSSLRIHKSLDNNVFLHSLIWLFNMCSAEYVLIWGKNKVIL